MGQINENELQAMGYKKKFDYSQYSHDNDVNVIPKNDFKRLIRDTFKTITEVVKETYGPYGSQYTLNELNQTSSTKDGYNTFEAIHFSHQYKQMVKLTIGKICSRVNEVVGDGTTSCLLLAEKIFDSINETLKTPEDERRIDSILTDIQKFFNDSLEFAKEYDLVKPLTHQSLESVIMMAANHDKRLRDTIINALDVKYDSESNVSSINNVSIQSRIDQGVSTKYEILKMPGNYRVEVGMFPNDIVSLADKKNVVLLVYDHNFNAADWAALLDAYTTKYFLNKPATVLNSDGTLSKNTTDDIERPTILICAVHFDQAVIDDHIKRFLQNEYRIGRKHNLIPVTIRGSYARNEARDLAAVADVPCHTLYTPKIEFEDFDKTTTVTVFNNDCLCLYDVKPPVDYIDALNIDMQNEESSSRRMLMKKRIDAMTMAKSDTTINLTVPNSLEQKMIEDKIHESKLGVKMRSKSEVLIANIFTDLGAPYLYEFPVYLGYYGTRFSDFLVLNVRLRKVFYCEHFGMMDNADYCAKSLEKIHAYEKSGHFPGSDLIIFHETSNKPLDTQLVRSIAEHYLL